MESDDDFIHSDINIIAERVTYCRKTKEYKERRNPFEVYTDSEFTELYRFNKETARFIIDVIKDDLVHNSNRRGSPVPPEIMVMATIRYIAKGSYQKDIGDVHGISQQGMSIIIKKVVNALASKCSTFINFPLDFESLRLLKQGFYEIAQFPQCIGAIDCSHFKIKNPGGERGGRYRCRKGYYSINVQMICDWNYKIMDIVARWRGSAHDSRIWRESTIKRRLEISNLQGGVLLGDKGYPTSCILLTPFRISTELSFGQQRFNRAHVLTRNLIERTFGQMKNKFRICFNGIAVNLNTAKNMIIAIAILHNIARDHNCTFLDDDSDELNDENEDLNVEETGENTNTITLRDRFVDRYFT